MSQSLEEVFESVPTDKHPKGWRRILSYLGPAYLVSIGYMDPGNWATDLAGGSMYAYKLLWVLLLSNIMAILLQSLAARLGIVARLDLAQANRVTYPKKFNYILWVLAEIAIASTDLAEVIGMAIGLKLLFGIDLMTGVMLTFLDTFLLLYLQKLGMRKMEAFIVTLIGIIGLSFLIELIMARPDMSEVSKGFIPTSLDGDQLFIAIGILGATVMPHNLYLHSAIIQTRKILRDPLSIRRALKYSFIDSAIALNIAFFVNSAILILAAAVFYKSGNYEIAGIEEAHELLQPLLGSRLAPTLFAVALIAAGQSSTITGTISGQIVMEGYLNLRLNPILRRLITRTLAILPAMIVIWLAGDHMVDYLLVLSQVILSFQLAFAVIPLIIFTSDKTKMGDFAISFPYKIAAWIIAATISVLNMRLVYSELSLIFVKTDSLGIRILLISITIFFIVCFILMFYYPIRNRRRDRQLTSIHHFSDSLDNMDVSKRFNKILVTVDFTKKDKQVMEYAIAMASPTTVIVLLHVTESPVVKFLGEDTNVEEVDEDYSRLLAYKHYLDSQGLHTEVILGMKDRVNFIIQMVNEKDADLLIMGRHGHKAVKDFVYGQTINKVRHSVNIPVLII